MAHDRAKIVFVLPAMTAGGAERVIITLMNHLDQTKYTPHFIAVSNKGNIDGWIKNDIPAHYLDKRNIYTGIGALHKKLKQIQPDIVMTTMIHSNSIVLCLRPFFRNTRFIVRESSLPATLVTQYGWKGCLCKLAYKYLYPYADLVLSPTHVITKEFEDVFGISTGNHEVLYNPVDEEAIRQTIKVKDDNAKAPDSSVVRFVAVGRLSQEKGYDILIEGLKNFHMPEGFDWQLEIIGTGPQSELLQEYISRNDLDDKITLKGYISPPWPYLAQADCLLLPSRWEGLPNVVLESLSCGVPVIAMSTAGGIGEIRKACGNDAVLIAENMSEFLEYLAGKRPISKHVERESILPEEFKQKNVLKEFSDMLDDLLDHAS